MPDESWGLMGAWRGSHRRPVLQGPRKRLRGLRVAGQGLGRGLSGRPSLSRPVQLMPASASMTPLVRISEAKGERPGQFSLSMEASDPATG